MFNTHTLSLSLYLLIVGSAAVGSLLPLLDGRLLCHLTPAAAAEHKVGYGLGGVSMCVWVEGLGLQAGTGMLRRTGGLVCVLLVVYQSMLSCATLCYFVLCCCVFAPPTGTLRLPAAC